MKNQEIRDAQALPMKPNMGINETFKQVSIFNHQQQYGDLELASG